MCHSGLQLIPAATRKLTCINLVGMECSRGAAAIIPIIKSCGPENDHSCKCFCISFHFFSSGVLLFLLFMTRVDFAYWYCSTLESNNGNFPMIKVIICSWTLIKETSALFVASMVVISKIKSLPNKTLL